MESTFFFKQIDTDGNPNPTAGDLNVRIYNEEQKAAILKIFDCTGRIIKKMQWKEGEMPQSWEEILVLEQNDIYFLQTQIGDQFEMRKIIVTDLR